MPAKPVSDTFDPFVERIAGRTADLVLSAVRPEFLNPGRLPAAYAVPDDAKPDAANDEVFTIDEFCTRNRISRSNLYKQWKAGVGPQYFRAGTAVRITRRAASQWLFDREAAEKAEPNPPQSAKAESALASV
jgi:hypothetical protein